MLLLNHTNFLIKYKNSKGVSINMSKVYKPKWKEASKEQLVDLIEIFDAMWKKQTGRPLQKDIMKEIKKRSK
jgi:hypothetical protein